jgi:hypothetical protein
MKHRAVWILVLVLLVLSLLFSVFGIPRATGYVLERSYGRIVTVEGAASDDG